MYSIKRELPRSQVNAISNRYKVRAFKESQLMHEFLNKQYDNEWQVMGTPIKSGTYFEQYDCSTRSFKLLNVKLFTL